MSALLRQARTEAGITQSELARRLGVTQPTVASWERPGANPTVRTLERAMAATGHRLEVVKDPDPADQVDTSQLRERLALSPAERLDVFQRSQGNLHDLLSGARRVPR